MSDETLSAEERERLRAVAEAATPGPWHWSGNTKTRSLDLSTWISGWGRCTVMGFRRWGMQSAKPMFADEGHMLVDGDELVEWEVCKAATDPSDRRLYRHDVSDIRHPDAQHIAAFDPPTVLRLLDEVDRLAAEVERLRQCCALDHEHIEVAERERDRLAAEAGDLRTSTDHYASAASILRQERDAARAEVALRTVERDGAMAKVERVLAEHDHADTCGSILSPGAGYPCSCWRAALADRVERPDGHLSAANHVDGIRVPQGAETPSDRRTGAESGTPGVEGPMHERLTDVLVWFTPGDRAKAEEMARAVIEAGFRDGGQA